MTRSTSLSLTSDIQAPLRSDSLQDVEQHIQVRYCHFCSSLHTPTLVANHLPAGNTMILSSRVARSLDRVKRLCADSPTHHVYPTRVFGSRRRAYIDLIHLARSDTPCTSVHSAITIMNARVQANRPRNPEPTGRSSPGATICCRPDAMAGRAKPFGRVASSTRSPTRPPWSKPAGVRVRVRAEGTRPGHALVNAVRGAMRSSVIRDERTNQESRTTTSRRQGNDSQRPPSSALIMAHL